MNQTKHLLHFLILCLGISCLTSCSKDDDDLQLDKISGIYDLAGLWLATDNSGDWFLVTSANHQTTTVDFNSVGMYWNGMYQSYGVPRCYTEDGVTVFDSGASKFMVEAYNAKKGLITIYNPTFLASKQFRKSTTPGNVAVIVNESERGETFNRVDISVYAEGSNDELTLIYSASLPGGTLTLHSVPFWLGGVQSTVKAEFTSGYTGEKFNATWDHLEPNKYYSLTY